MGRVKTRPPLGSRPSSFHVGQGPVAGMELDPRNSHDSQSQHTILTCRPPPGLPVDDPLYPDGRVGDLRVEALQVSYLEGGLFPNESLGGAGSDEVQVQVQVCSPQGLVLYTHQAEDHCTVHSGSGSGEYSSRSCPCGKLPCPADQVSGRNSGHCLGQVSFKHSGPCCRAACSPPPDCSSRCPASPPPRPSPVQNST